MIISVQGNLIETKNIYRVGKIKNNIPNALFSNTVDIKFDIESFDNKKLTVFKEIKSRNFLTDTYDNLKLNLDEIRNIVARIDLENHPLYLKHFEDIERMRNEVLKYWNAEQAEYPQINFEV